MLSSSEPAGRLRQQLCWNIVRILSTKVCRRLPNSMHTADFLTRIEDAAKKIVEEDGCCEELYKREITQAKEWIADLQALHKELRSEL